MTSAAEKERFMKKALRLARKGAGSVSPNPLVGAVIVKHGTAVGQGYHRVFGGAHAEINALTNAGPKARGADLYVNLEPCCHHGKTPPCVDALIEHGIRRVYVGMVDPNPAVCGKGIRKLKKAGVDIETGLLENECRRLNESFIKYVTKQTPFVILKAAATLDGNIATPAGDSKWITSEKSRTYVHKIRASVDAVMVGVGTVLADDPLLTVRLYKGVKKDPVRIIVDSALRIPLSSNVLKPELAEKTIIATAGVRAASKKAKTIRGRGARILSVPLKGARPDLRKLVALLGKRQISSLLIEGGSEINASALASGIVDKVMLFYAPKIIGGKKAIGMVGGDGVRYIADACQISDASVRRVGCDVLVEGYINKGTR